MAALIRPARRILALASFVGCLALVGCASYPAGCSSCQDAPNMQGGLPYDPLAADIARTFQELIVGIDYETPPEPAAVNRKAMATRQKDSARFAQQASHTQVLAAETLPAPASSTLPPQAPPPQLADEPLAGERIYSGDPAAGDPNPRSDIAQTGFIDADCPTGAEFPPPGPPPRFFPVPSRPVFSQQPTPSWLR